MNRFSPRAQNKTQKRGRVKSATPPPTPADAHPPPPRPKQHVTPSTTEKIYAVLGHAPGADWREELNWGAKLTGRKVAEALVLFPRPEKAESGGKR